MEEITGLTVSQIRVFAADVMPLTMLATEYCTQKVKTAFSFGESATAPGPDGKVSVMFSKGELKVADTLVVINRLWMDSRRVLLEVVGTSSQTSQAYANLLERVGSDAGIDVTRLDTPILFTESCSCVATLDFAFESLFATSLIGFLSNDLSKTATNAESAASVRPLRFEAEVSYQIKDQALIDNKVNLVNKKFVIAPREGTPAGARRYFVASPFDSDTHLAVVSRLEKLLSKTTNAMPPRRGK